MVTISDFYPKLISAWPLYEESGLRKDKRGTNHLIVTNDVGRELCLLGHGISLTDDDTSPTYCQIADPSSLEPGSGNFSIFACFKEHEHSLVEPRVIVCKANSTRISYIIQLGLGSIEFVTSSDGVATDTLEFSDLPTMGVAHAVIVTWNATTRVKNLYLDGTLVATETLPLPSGIYNGTQPFCIGHIGGGGLHMDGVIGPVYFFNSELTATEAEFLWNDGKAVALYPEVLDNTIDVDFNNASQVQAYLNILNNTLNSLIYEPSRYTIDNEVTIDNRGRMERILKAKQQLEQELIRLIGNSSLQGPDREIY